LLSTPLEDDSTWLPKAFVVVVQGTTIEATLWGDFADKHHDTLEEGKVSSC
jgi:hypothetical protein